MNAAILKAAVALLVLVSCAPSTDNDEKQDGQLEARGPSPKSAPAVPPPSNRPKTQTARCTGVDRNDHPQTLVLESRWVPDEGRAVIFVMEDSTGLLKPGNWLEDLSASLSESDRRGGIVWKWDGQEGKLSKRVGDRFLRITFTQHDFASASVVYLTRPYSEDEETALRFSEGGWLSLAGHCRLFYGNELRSYKNGPPTPNIL
ncbi:Putative secreted protein [Sphingopyxis fribergensis]|uniref:Putative secreted protein n=1 Tax=Sphingopyxis fribergensis TaxID=1515612 RepID=A0A0A7PEX1_9SPHN|nr:hypothetical protein [Sphingopyxis fribergensis]AJA08641.1 Putative secreted protein [Sphingopyxis fribergensis]